MLFILKEIHVLDSYLGIEKPLWRPYHVSIIWMIVQSLIMKELWLMPKLEVAMKR